MEKIKNLLKENKKEDLIVVKETENQMLTKLSLYKQALQIAKDFIIIECYSPERRTRYLAEIEKIVNRANQ